MKKIRFALIGTSSVAPRHAEAIINSRNAKLVAVRSSSKERAESFAKRFGIEAYTDYKALLKRDDIDAVDIVTMNCTHADFGIQAALAGKHVLVEKPIDTSLEKADELIRMCKRNKVVLSVIFQRRFDKTTQKLKRMIEKGRFGKIFLVRASSKKFRPQKYFDGWRGMKKYSGGGVLITHTIHVIDLLHYLVGPVSSVDGKIATSTHDTENEDVGIGLLKFKNGALGVIEGTNSVCANTPDRIEIYGSRGSIVVEEGRLGPRITQFNFGNNSLKSRFYYLILSKIQSLIPTRAGTFKAQIENFAEAVIANKPLVVEAESAKKSLEIVLALYESSKSGREKWLTETNS